MALGDINFRADNNIDCTIEDATGVKQVATLTVNAQAAVGKGLDVNVQDQTTPTVILPFNKVTNSTTLAAEALINQRVIVVTSATGIITPVPPALGSFIVLFSPTEERFMFASVVSAVGTSLTLDTPLDFTFPAGTNVDIATIEMSVNGAVTPQIFGLRGTGAPPGVDITVDITRIIFGCIADSPVDLSTFADIAGLTNGLVLRRRDGTNRNIFNVKTNRDIASLTFDFTVRAATNPAQGEDGFVSRLTFAGQNKLGVAIRLPVGEDLEFIVQDNLSAITSLIIIAQGHIVEEP